MSFIQQFINEVCHIFGELENINEYYVKFNVIQLIKKKFNQCIEIIVYQENEIERQKKEIQRLENELEWINNTFFTTLNRDLIHIRHSISQISDITEKTEIPEKTDITEKTEIPEKKPQKYVEKLF